jgi:hypothetical protein
MLRREMDKKSGTDKRAASKTKKGEQQEVEVAVYGDAHLCRLQGLESDASSSFNKRVRSGDDGCGGEQQGWSCSGGVEEGKLNGMRGARLKDAAKL